MQCAGPAEVTGCEPLTYGCVGAPMPSGRCVSALRIILLILVRYALRLFVPVHYPDHMIFHPPPRLPELRQTLAFRGDRKRPASRGSGLARSALPGDGGLFLPDSTKNYASKNGQNPSRPIFSGLDGFLVLKLLPDYPTSSSVDWRPAQWPDFTQSRRRTASSHRPPCRCRLFQNSPPGPWPRPATERRGAWGQGGCSSPRGAAGRAVR